MQLGNAEIEYRSKLPRPVRIFWALNVLLGLVCIAVVAINKSLLRLPYPYNFPFASDDPWSRWVDFVCFQPRFVLFHRLDFFSEAPQFALPYMYPAPVALLYKAFYSTGQHAIVFFFAITLTLVVVLAFLLGRAMVRKGVKPSQACLFLLSAIVFSYPLWFEYLLSNMEICTFLMIAFAVLAYLRGNFYTAAALIGVAGSMKIFPFVYLALFLTSKKYRELAVGIATAFVVNVFSLWLVCPSLGVSYRGVRAGLNHFRMIYMLRFRPMETSFDHSLFGFVKRIFRSHLGNTIAPQILTAYLALAVVSGLALYFFRIRKLPILNQILCLGITSILLPPTSHDYTLINLYIPWGLMVLYALQAASAHRSMQNLIGPLICFAILFSPQSEVIYHHIGLSGQIKAVVLVVLLILTLSRPWEFSEGASPSDSSFARSTVHTSFSA